ncbi:hypothetical protein G7Y89_g10960 [Cudoniella acicularis]|uniref:Uncharacterized protein n=1 Tax=Cudoniella acicularis TaxID=354080 RepID=A0A8H4RD95_9HELO|nr:hypothetical protein G7Y89_g10960 [Cudoniella acicularis]
MPKHPFDSFLSTGAIDPPRRTFRADSRISPLSIPRSMPETSFVPSPHSKSDTPSPKAMMQSRSPSQHPHGPPISPPKTRSSSAEDSTAALIEDWRAYTQKLRGQYEGEKAHMLADRARAEEVMNEERSLWDQEREILKAQIKMLEEASGEKAEMGIIDPHAMGYRQMFMAAHPGSVISPGLNPVSTGSIDGHSRTVPQESGRNADGTPFYAPAPRNPSRTFSSSETSEMRVDSISAPRESAIRVTSKELTSSDFGLQSPNSNQDLETIPETPKETIDISHIQPELEGVPIKATAVEPSFAAKVLSPDYSPSKLSPNSKPFAPRPSSRSPPNRSNGSSSEKAKEREKKTLEVVCEPENRRLTMHAGHTPNHSMSKFEFLGGAERGGDESENATPRQAHHPQNLHHPSVAPVYGQDGTDESEEEHDQGDRALTGLLGLTNEAATDDVFLAQLHEKLEEARKSEGASPSSESTSSISSTERRNRPRHKLEEDDEKDDGPLLRLKPSFNFGRPMGSM